MKSAVEIKDIHKHYQNVMALQGVDLQIPSGEFFGLLGPNGAGKSTLINCIVGLVKPSQGEAWVFGDSVKKNPLAAKAHIGFSPQEVNVERFFNLRRTLEFQGGFYGTDPDEAKRRAQELLEKFGLEDKARQQFFRLSGGMQKRLIVARALMSQPRLLILDEPTAGVDVSQRRDLWKYLRDLNRDGTTIILTTHYIDEAEALCERVGIINHGRILELGRPKDLIEKYCTAQICLEIEGEVSEQEFQGIPQLRISENKIFATAPTLGATLEKLLAILRSKPGRRILDVHIQRGNLEEVFIQVTGKSLNEEAINVEGREEPVARGLNPTGD